MHDGLMWLVGIPVVFQYTLAVPCTALTAGESPAVSVVQGDCDLKESGLKWGVLRKSGKASKHGGARVGHNCVYSR